MKKQGRGVIGSATPRQSEGRELYKRMRWSKEEEEDLREGVRLFGKGNWMRMREYSSRLAKFTSVQLKVGQSACGEGGGEGKAGE